MRVRPVIARQHRDETEASAAASVTDRDVNRTAGSRPCARAATASALDEHTRDQQHARLAHHHPDDVAAAGTERHPDADLVAPSRD
jgi:hypothetical protein